MLTIGLTGPSGAGKGLVARLCADYGIPSIDADQVYHQLLVPPSDCLLELVAHFGADILTPSGTLDRPALAHKVFACGTEEDHLALNRITHRHVIARTEQLRQAYADAATPAVLLDAPLLIESGLDARCDKIIAVIAPPDVRLRRIMVRDHLSQEAALERLRAQKPDAFYTQRAHAVLVNDQSTEAPRAYLVSLLKDWGVLPA